MDLASEESERLPCLLTLLDMGADVNASDKHGTFTLACLIKKHSFLQLFILQTDFCALITKEKLLCSMPWPAVMDSRCTTLRTSSFSFREVLTAKCPSSSLIFCFWSFQYPVNPLQSEDVLVCIPVHLYIFFGQLLPG